MPSGFFVGVADIKSGVAGKFSNFVGGGFGVFQKVVGLFRETISFRERVRVFEELFMGVKA
jgi:hypothetical protein